MRQNVFRERESQSEKHGRPVNAVRGDDVLADEVVGCRPNRFSIGKCPSGNQIAVFVQFHHSAHIVQQGVKPDVGHIVGIERQGNAPAQARFRAADAKVVQRLF